MRLIITFLCALCITSCATDDPILEPEVVEEEEMEVEGEANLVFEGDVVLVSQQEVEDFGAIGYTEVTGNLSIDFGVSSLEALSTLSVVGENLFIQNTELTNLNGLENITIITGILGLNLNFNLNSIEALSNLTSVGDLSIVGHHVLESYSGLENVQIQQGGRLILSANTIVPDASILANSIPSNLDLVHISGGMNNLGGVVPQALDDLSFLSNLTSAGFIEISNFAGESLQGLHNITTANNVIVLGQSNSSFSSTIASLDGLAGLETVNSLSIIACPVISDLSGLENITEINDSVSITANIGLTDFCALTNALTNQIPENSTIEANAYNPTIQDLIDGNCSE